MNIFRQYLQKLRDRVYLFNGFNNDELVRVLREVTCQQTYYDNDIIFLEGDEGTTMYLIFEGQVRITRETKIIGEEELATLDPGDCFGEMSIICGTRRSARAVAIGRTTVLGFSESALHAFPPDITHKLYRNFASILAERVYDLNQIVTRMTEAHQDLSERHVVLTDQLSEKHAPHIEGRTPDATRRADEFVSSVSLLEQIRGGWPMTGT